MTAPMYDFTAAVDRLIAASSQHPADPPPRPVQPRPLPPRARRRRPVRRRRRAVWAWTPLRAALRTLGTRP